MSAIPLQAKLKREAAAKRDAKLTSKQAESGGNIFRRPDPSRFSSTNRPHARFDRSQDYFTSQELEQALEKSNNTGGRFRYMFLVFVVITILILGYAKYDVEMNIEVPQIESGRGFGEINENEEVEKMGKDSTVKQSTYYKVSKQEIEELDKHFKVLGVENRYKQEHFQEKKPNKGPDEKQAAENSKIDPDLERRREMWKIKQDVKKARDAHTQQYGAMVSCGKACREKHMQVESAFQALDSILPREVYKTFYGAKSTKEKRWASPEEIKKSYEEKKSKLEKETPEEDRDMALAELKDAYDILRSPEARAYYHLYGRKPIEAMKKTSARHGGWGQELMLGTYKYRMIFAVLDYFSNSWAETIVIGLLVLLLLARLPSIISQAVKMKKVLEEQDDLDDMTLPEDEQESKNK